MIMDLNLRWLRTTNESGYLFKNMQVLQLIYPQNNNKNIEIRNLREKLEEKKKSNDTSLYH